MAQRVIQGVYTAVEAKYRRRLYSPPLGGITLLYGQYFGK